MKALIYKGPYEFSLSELPKPEIRPDEVLVHIRAVGVCGSDVHGFAGKTGRREPGMVMGHEISGTVVECGDEVKTLKAGQNVVLQPILYCGHCEPCLRNMTSVCLNKKMIGVNMGTVGGLAEYIAVRASSAFPISDSIPLVSAALVEPFAVGAGAVARSGVREGDTVAIVGAGMIGLAVLAMVLQRKPSKVFIIDQFPKKLGLASEIGAIPVNFREEDPLKTIRSMTGGLGVDVAFEAVGIARTVQLANSLAKVAGEIVWIGNSQKIIEMDMQEIVVLAKTIKGIYCYTDDDFRSAIRFVEANRDLAARFAEEETDFQGAETLYSELAKGQKDLFRAVVVTE
jgi:threonine dehydrogenase-like Zn-dependent dehydrogenase